MDENTERPNDESGYASPAEQGDPANIAVKAGFGGLLMGLANLVPGISGGTMLLAAGVYTDFINAIADVTRLRFRFRSVLVLAVVVATAAAAALAGAGLLKDLVVEHRWIMYSLFIGLTLGGVPAVWQMATPANAGFFVASAVALLLMISLALLQAYGISGGNNDGMIMHFVAGLAGASAMVLPGLSGAYILLLLGQYVPILTAIDQFKEALKSGDLSAAFTPAFDTLLPVGVGVVAGVVVVANLMRILLRKHRKATLGVLMGLLLGSLAGLWPFQQAVEPKPGDTVKGQVVTVESAPGIEREDWPSEYFRPSSTQVAGSLALIAAGFAVTLAVARIGGGSED